MEKFFEWEYRFMMFLQNSIRGPLQNKVMWCITSLENAGFLSIAACLALLLQPKWRRVGEAATVSMILEFLVVNLLLKNWVARVRPYHLLEDLILLVQEPADYSFPSGHTGAAFAVASVMFLGMPHSIGVPALIVASLIFPDLSGGTFPHRCTGRSGDRMRGRICGLEADGREAPMRKCEKARDFNSGSVLSNILYFSLPYLLSYFLQTLYGMADLFIIGQFDGTAATTAVSLGSQVMHMLTVILVGLAMGTTVSIGQAVGARDKKRAGEAIGNTVVLFLGVSVALMVLLTVLVRPIVALISTPEEAVAGTIQYLTICFIGIPFITAYNVISSIFRVTRKVLCTLSPSPVASISY